METKKGEEILEATKRSDVFYVGINKHINPKKDDKFSPNLYRFLTYHKNKHFANIFQDSKTNFYYIGMMDDGWFVGSQLMNVFCFGSKTESFAWTPKDSICLVDVTNWFWNTYFEIGKETYNLPGWQRCPLHIAPYIPPPIQKPLAEQKIRDAGQQWAIEHPDETMGTNSALNRGFVAGAKWAMEELARVK